MLSFSGKNDLSLLKHSELLQRSLQYVWHPCTQMKHHEQFPLMPIKRAQGVWLYDEQEQAYFDGISSWWVNLFGHANPFINQALKDQLDTLEHVMLAGFTHQPAVDLAQRLSGLTNYHLGHCFFASDGASATEIALKMSFHAWQNKGFSKKQKFVYLEGSYHGETLGALIVTDVPIFRQAYSSLLQTAYSVPSPDYRKALAGESAKDCALKAALAVEQLFIEKADEIAAFIVEPLVQCASGMAMHDPLYLSEIRRLCTQYQVTLIFDEIAVGCGRTGTFFASEQMCGSDAKAVWPDLICLSKGISGGYLPLSLVLCNEDIYQAFYDPDIRRGFLHSHSYTGNPLACRAAVAVLDLFEKDNVLLSNQAKSMQFFDLLKTHLAPFSSIVHLRKQGMIFAFDVSNAPAGFSLQVFTKALEHHLLLRPIANTVYIMPPYIINSEQMQFIAQSLAKILHELMIQ